MLIFNKNTHLQALTGQERAELALAVDDLRRLEQVIHRTKRTPKRGYRPHKLAKVPKNVGGKKPPCRGCGAPVPHRTREEWIFHWKEPRKRCTYWLLLKNNKQGLKNAVKVRVANNYRRAVERRTAIFREMAPRAAEMMSADEIEKVVTSVRSPTHGTLWSYLNLRAYIRKHYGNATGWKYPPDTHTTQQKRNYYLNRKARRLALDVV